MEYKNNQEQIINLLKQFGVSNYKEFVDNYNKELEKKRDDGGLKTPEDIISSLTGSKTMN